MTRASQDRSKWAARMQRLTILGFGVSVALLAAEAPKQTVEVTHTEQMTFPSGGTLRFQGSSGFLTIEGWDKSEVEIMTTKSTKSEYSAKEREKAMRELEKVRISATQQGNELLITTDFPRRRIFPVNPREEPAGVDLEYRIKAPANAKLIVAHRYGNVNVDALTGDIDVTALNGQITLHLPDEDYYAIMAKSDLGAVNSDFRGPEKRRWWLLGHEIVNTDSPATRKLNLAVGFGDIVILRTRVPNEPAPVAQTLKPGAQ